MTETLDPISASVAAKFDTYAGLLNAVARGAIRFLLVSGSPGLGKTFETTAQLAKYPRAIVTKHSGHVTPLALYRDLFNHRTVQDILVFDDCDDAFKNKDCLSLLKAAADTSKVRLISWASSSRLVPIQRFEFAGRIIIITNRPVFTDPALAPLADRAHCFELSLTQEERLCRILSLLKTIANDTAYFDVADWITRNAGPLHVLGRLTVRTAVKCCELARIEGDWQAFAALTLLQKDEAAEDAFVL